MSPTTFNSSDLEQIKQAGLSPESIERQLELFSKPVPYSRLLRPATMGDGILSIAPDQVARLTAKFEAAQDAGRISKFVPASGAATRMFKALFQELARDENDRSAMADSVGVFFEKLETFAFFPALKAALNELAVDTSTPVNQWPKKKILSALLTEEGLDYGRLPKGLLAFHRSGETSVTPVEEHFQEAIEYGLNHDGEAQIHFTVSKEHQGEFEALVASLNEQLSARNIHLNVSFSVQKPATDTIAASPDGTPFRNPEGKLVFRPGGHGALIENLNDLQGDILILKNIDNVVPANQLTTTVQYKKLLGGMLLDVQQRIFKYLEMLEDGVLPPRREIFRFMEQFLGLKTGQTVRFEDAELREYLRKILNRPIRVCGMVRNQGEPGGGPFWVQGLQNEESLQIVETSQIDQSHPDQKKILQQATHFNPVDLVCGVRDYQGQAFPLLDFIDPNAYFISSKSQFGRALLALERPGLWNGAMAKWNTLFVEVPLSTFNPVKTVNDLLRPEHLGA